MAKKRNRGKVTDITIRMRRKDGRRVSEDEAKAALWAAHKIAQRPGGDILRELREWDIEAVNWRNVYRSGKEKRYRYTGKDAAEAIGAMGGIFEWAGLEGLRVGTPDTTGGK